MIGQVYCLGQFPDVSKIIESGRGPLRSGFKVRGGWFLGSSGKGLGSPMISTGLLKPPIREPSALVGGNRVES